MYDSFVKKYFVAFLIDGQHEPLIAISQLSVLSHGCAFLEGHPVPGVANPRLGGKKI
jgi:hypothetical protein